MPHRNRINRLYALLFFLLAPAMLNGQLNPLVVEQLAPTGPVVCYEKIEWGIELPPQVNDAVRRWINNQRTGRNDQPALNPFDPEDIDLHAVIEFAQPSTPLLQGINGFYFEDFKRSTQTSDPNGWGWLSQTNPYPFRLRWSAIYPGEHRMEVILTTRDLGTWHASNISFIATSGNPENGFIRISDNQHYFATPDGHEFMPIGLNLTEGSFGCNCKEGAAHTAACEDCYEWGADDPCCGIRAEKKLRAGIPGTKIREYSVACAAYLKFHRVLDTLAAKGGNAFRTFLDPMAFEIEFEQINNYADRQYQAWEFDALLDHCHQLGLRMELNLQYHYSITHHSFGYDRFDWGDQYNCKGCGKDTRTTGTSGWCYPNACADVKDPVDFLTSPCAQKFYKNKLRYIIARWGYSPNIYVMELMSEMNNIGNGSEWEVNVDTDGDGQKDDAIEHPIESLYMSDPIRTRKAVAAWHEEMARFIHHDLQHDRHCIAADYTGTAPMMVDLNRDGDCSDESIGEHCNPCQSASFDHSWMSPWIDVIAFSNYTAGLNRWEHMSQLEYSKNPQSNGLQCGWDNPNDPNDNSGYHSPVPGYRYLNKPVIHAENGLVFCLDGDYTGFVKDMYTDALGGHASSGMSWDEWSEATHWEAMQPLAAFWDSVQHHNMHPGKGSWEPYHTYSKWRWHRKRGGLIEAIAMRHDEACDAFGFMMNRSWNHYTQGVGSCQQEGMRGVFSGSNAMLSTMRTAIHRKHRVKLRDVRRGRYEVTYYQWSSGAWKMTQKMQRSRFGSLRFKGYPDLSEENPFVFFIIQRLP